MRIDAHQHFWNFDPIRDSWITEEMGVIRRDFLPGDLLPLLRQHRFDGSVLVQASQTEDENHFMLQLAEDHPFVKGVVGWVDLCNERVAERLAYYRNYSRMKGFRHVLQAEADRAFMLRPAFLRGLGLLEEYGFAYDILVFTDQLPYVVQMVKQFPSQRFVIDHIAKPDIRLRKTDKWTRHIEELAGFPNVYCKVSGMVTEADWQGWQEVDFRPYLDVVLRAFGKDRLMFGSDWPVCLVASSYGRMLDITEHYFADFDTADSAKFFGGNATRFYQLES